MGTIISFENLEIWKRARELNNDLYNLFKTTSLGKDFIFRQQMDKSAGSVMDNIAEGFEREGNKEFIHFLSIAKASVGELRSQLYRAMDREHITQEKFNHLNQNILILIKQIKSLIGHLKRSHLRGSKF